jgi:predicted membrane protein
MAPTLPLLGWGHFFAVLLGIVIGYWYAHGQALNREARAERDMSAYEVLR